LGISIILVDGLPANRILSPERSHRAMSFLDLRAFDRSTRKYCPAFRREKKKTLPGSPAATDTGRRSAKALRRADARPPAVCNAPHARVLRGDR
jgi:hypothetical protein